MVKTEENLQLHHTKLGRRKTILECLVSLCKDLGEESASAKHASPLSLKFQLRTSNVYILNQFLAYHHSVTLALWECIFPMPDNEILERHFSFLSNLK
jgi:hypothetical protein